MASLGRGHRQAGGPEQPFGPWPWLEGLSKLGRWMSGKEAAASTLNAPTVSEDGGWTCTQSRHHTGLLWMTRRPGFCPLGGWEGLGLAECPSQPLHLSRAGTGLADGVSPHSLPAGASALSLQPQSPIPAASLAAAQCPSCSCGLGEPDPGPGLGFQT